MLFLFGFFFFFFKQKTAYEMVMSDWSSDVCSSDLALSDAWATRYASMLEPSPLCAGVATRAAWPARPAARCATGGTTAAGGALATDRLDHASNAVRSEPIFTRT